MAFLAEMLPEMAPELMSMAGEDTSMPGTLIQGYQNQQLQQNSFAFGERMQDSAFTQQNQMQQQQLAYMGNQNQASREFATQYQTNNFNQQNALQQNQFQQQNQLMSQQNSNNMKMTAIQGGMQMGSNLISNAMGFAQNAQLASLQRTNFDYMTGKASDAYTSAGLPSWLAFSGGSGGLANAFPKQSQVLTGSNTFSSQLPGNTASQPWTGSSSQIALGVGAIPQAI